MNNFFFFFILGRKSGKGWFIYDDKKKGKDREVNLKAKEILDKHFVTPKVR